MPPPPEPVSTWSQPANPMKYCVPPVRLSGELKDPPPHPPDAVAALKLKLPKVVPPAAGRSVKTVTVMMKLLLMFVPELKSCVSMPSSETSADGVQYQPILPLGLAQ